MAVHGVGLSVWVLPCSTVWFVLLLGTIWEKKMCCNLAI